MRGCRCRGLTLCAQCTTLAQRAGVLPPLLDSSRQLSEAVFQAAVIELAKASGWMVYFTKDSRRSPSGFPDLVLAPDPSQAGAHPQERPLYAVELKTDTGQLSQAQEAWLTALQGSTGVVSAVWRPSQWTEIVEQLRG
jgi:VRR-NUC domain